MTAPPRNFHFKIRCVISLLTIGIASSLPAQDWRTGCEQVVVVVTEGWASSQGRLATFSKGNGEWRAVRGTIPVTVGDRGLGWGLGLHRERTTEPLKREGDKRAPAGVFRLDFGFGVSPFLERAFPYRQVFARDRWVDDPSSRFYNQWVVDDDARFPKDWSSAEVLMRPDGIYDHVIAVGHNRSGIRSGRGSAIFMHSWFGPGKSTIGCTAMEKREVIRLLEWLDAGKEPVLIQVPKKYLEGLELPLGLGPVIHRALIN